MCDQISNKSRLHSSKRCNILICFIYAKHTCVLCRVSVSMRENHYCTMIYTHPTKKAIIFIFQQQGMRCDLRFANIKSSNCNYFIITDCKLSGWPELFVFDSACAASHTRKMTHEHLNIFAFIPSPHIFIPFFEVDFVEL